eukprot:CAMPEP_0177268212 /NCGR_PEP_ID=MMETSP0367-20130122/63691_1 /TAXON_ID=447022 ORGANISM="Scrippsiella hangoei-like, Strain SHHI-4" /NCGR_SAMPLE_ID=MMETSP0367 /ASSEMBLY_ACC=CAM_ASM_000362 /LENGTH=89 /DNA_ID=CAMNT_0018723821 /DNA_START=63 /DNA_END=329 /DNA_ORIENTATION=-
MAESPGAPARHVYENMPEPSSADEAHGRPASRPLESPGSDFESEPAASAVDVRASLAVVGVADFASPERRPLDRAAAVFEADAASSAAS